MSKEFWLTMRAQLVHVWKTLDRPAREKVTVAGVCLLAFIFYVAVWAPVQRRADDLARAVTRDESRLAIMQTQSQEALALRAQGAAKRDLSSSPLTLVEQAADRRSLRSNIRNMTQDPASGLHVSLDAAPFSLVVHWLNDLRTQNGIRVESAILEPNSTEGTVDAQLVLR